MYFITLFMDYGSVTMHHTSRGTERRTERRGHGTGRGRGGAARLDFLFGRAQQAVLQHQDRQRVVHSLPPQADALWSGPWDAFDDAACLEVDLCVAHIIGQPPFGEERMCSKLRIGSIHNCLQPHSLRPSSSEHTQYMLFQHFVLTLVHGPAVETAGTRGIEHLNSPLGLPRLSVLLPCCIGHWPAVLVALKRRHWRRTLLPPFLRLACAWLCRCLGGLALRGRHALPVDGRATAPGVKF